jgi:hypothetical protein
MSHSPGYLVKTVIPAKAGIHDLIIHLQFAEEKSWMPGLRRHDVEIAESHLQSHLVLSTVHDGRWCLKF